MIAVSVRCEGLAEDSQTWILERKIDKRSKV